MDRDGWGLAGRLRIRPASKRLVYRYYVCVRSDRRASAHEERNDGEYEKNEKADFREADRSAGDAAESENSRNDGDDQKC